MNIEWWQALALPPGASVLAVGCGTGYFARRLASDGFDVTGVDASAGTIDTARSHGTAANNLELATPATCHFPIGTSTPALPSLMTDASLSMPPW